MTGQRRDPTGKNTDAQEVSPILDEPVAEGSSIPARSKLIPGLYLVATPIGNMGDITYRAVEVLRHADVVACEDTRVSGKLLSRLGLSRPLTPYHEHNADRAGPQLLERIRQGAVVALVSDAGTPLVADPGTRLVRACRDEGLLVTAIPGASAVLTALQLSGLVSERFLFEGFLPSRAAARRQALHRLAEIPATLVFFESPHRTAETLHDMASVLGPRETAVCRELTKLYEETVRGLPAVLAERYTATPPRGEVVIVVAPPPEKVMPRDEAALDQALKQAVAEGLSVRDASAKIAAATGQPRREVYARALDLFRGPP